VLESFGVLNLWTYLAGVVFIIILPGPNTLYVLKTGVTRGVRAGYTAALGVFIGDAILIFCAYIGVASLIRTTPFLFTLVRFLGAIYLLFLGAKILYATFIQKNTAQQQQIEGGHSILRESVSFIYMTTLIFSGAMLAHFFNHKKGLAKLGNGLIGLLFLGFATRLATLSS
jgi:leucine efflux protein